MEPHCIAVPIAQNKEAGNGAQKMLTFLIVNAFVLVQPTTFKIPDISHSL